MGLHLLGSATEWEFGCVQETPIGSTIIRSYLVFSAELVLRTTYLRLMTCRKKGD